VARGEGGWQRTAGQIEANVDCIDVEVSYRGDEGGHLDLVLGHAHRSARTACHADRPRRGGGRRKAGWQAAETRDGIDHLCQAKESVCRRSPINSRDVLFVLLVFFCSA
jgi:hypothetical protein